MILLWEFIADIWSQLLYFVTIWADRSISMWVPDRSFARVKNHSFCSLACVKNRLFCSLAWGNHSFCSLAWKFSIETFFFLCKFVLILSNSGRLQWKVPNDQPRPPIKRLKPPDRPKCTRGPNRHSGSNCNIFLVIWMYLYPIDTALRIHSRYWLLLLSFTTIFPAEFAPFSRPNFVTFWVEHFWPKNFWARSLVYAACLSIPLYWAYRAISKKYRTIFVAQELAKL